MFIMVLVKGAPLNLGYFLLLLTTTERFMSSPDSIGADFNVHVKKQKKSQRNKAT